jgi:hypothetical protein
MSARLARDSWDLCCSAVSDWMVRCTPSKMSPASWPTSGPAAPSSGGSSWILRTPLRDSRSMESLFGETGTSSGSSTRLVKLSSSIRQLVAFCRVGGSQAANQGTSVCLGSPPSMPRAISTSSNMSPRPSRFSTQPVGSWEASMRKRPRLPDSSSMHGLLAGARIRQGRLRLFIRAGWTNPIEGDTSPSLEGQGRFS